MARSVFVKFDKIRCFLAFWDIKSRWAGSTAPAKAVLVYGKGASGVGSNVLGHGDAKQWWS